MSFILFIMSILLFSLVEHGFHVMFLMAYIGFFMTFLLPIVLTQVLTDNVGDRDSIQAGGRNIEAFFTFQAEKFYKSIYDLNWLDLHFEERRTILLLLFCAQKTISLKAGLFDLNYPLVTKVRNDFSNNPCVLI